MRSIGFALLVATASCGAAHPRFAAPMRIPLPANFQPLAFVVGDFNGDGAPDIVVTGESKKIVTMLNDGHGVFRTGIVSAAGAHPVALAAADVDGDGKLDVVVANHDTNHLTFLAGNGRGGFTPREVVVHSVPHPHTVALADVDGDRRPDVIFDSWGENRLMILSSRAGLRPPEIAVEVGRKPYWNCVAADLNGDGAIDLVVPNQGLGTVSILLGDGHAHFRHANGSPFPAGMPFSVAVGDVDGDHDLDIVVANYSGHVSDTSADGLTWIRNDGGGRFTPFPNRIAAGRYSARVATGDVDGDGRADVAFTNTAASAVTIVYGSPSGPRESEQIETMNAPNFVDLADLNHDGRADLIVSATSSGDLLVFFARK